MMHVYEIPTTRSNGYCFSGPVPIAFGNVDWMNAPPEGMARRDVEEALRRKNWFTGAPVGTRFLVLCDARDDLTFQMVRR